MRTPLNAIFGFTALARDNLHNRDNLKYYLNRINSSSEQLLDLIDKILEIASTDSADTHITEEECNLPKILENVKHALLPLSSEKKIKIVLDTSGLSHRDIFSDPYKLEKLLIYLTHNAIKYTPDGGRVTLRATEPDALPNDHAVYQFIVADNGIGIGPEFLGHIYEPFEREKNTTFSGVLGTGLGLTIVKNIVSVLGGTIEVQSAVGKGTTFTVTFHFRTQNHPIPLCMSTDETIEYLSRHKILLVEDNEINLEIETAILEGLGFVVDTAANGSIALEMMQKDSAKEYALILMDIQMPVMNGYEAAKEIRKLKDKKKAAIPIIAMTANAFDEDKQEALDSGMNGHIAKPIDVDKLFGALDEILE